MIAKCKGCESNNIIHIFQDKNYGKYVRVMTLLKRENSTMQARCTVCNTVNDFNIDGSNSFKILNSRHNIEEYQRWSKSNGNK